MKAFIDRHFGKFAYVIPLAWLFIIFVLFVVLPKAYGQEQFAESLKADERVTLTNIQFVPSCHSEIDEKQPNPETPIFERCVIKFKDNSPNWQATIKYCKNFEPCDAAGGKMKDMVIQIAARRYADTIRRQKAKK